MSHSWTWKALERVRHFCKLFATQLEETPEEEEPIVSVVQLARTTLAEKRIIDIFARCMTKIDKRKEVQSLRAELKHTTSTWTAWTVASRSARWQHFL